MRGASRRRDNEGRPHSPGGPSPVQRKHDAAHPSRARTGRPPRWSPFHQGGVSMSLRTAFASASPPRGFRLLQPLGRGAFGEVWRAEAPGGVEVAVKVIHRALKLKEAQREFDALQLIKKLRHPFLLS